MITRKLHEPHASCLIHISVAKLHANCRTIRKLPDHTQAAGPHASWPDDTQAAETIRKLLRPHASCRITHKLP